MKYLYSLLLFILVTHYTSIVWAQEIPVPSGSKILLVGDSLAVGLGPEFKRVSKLTGYVPVVDAKNGTTIRQWVNWMPSKLRSYQPQMVLISLGTNDSVGTAGWITEHPEAIDTLQNQITEAGAIPVWIGMPVMQSNRLPYAPYVNALLIERVDWYFYSMALTFPRAPDGIHSTPLGYKIWMDAIWEWMFDFKLIQFNDGELRE